MEPMTFIALLLIGLVVVVVGRMILDRLPKRTDDFTFEDCDYHLAFRVETVIEEEFQVAYIDRWEAGRTFSLHGPTVSYEYDEGSNAPKIEGRAGVKISSCASWFESSRIGSVKIYESGAAESFVCLPYQIAQQLLEEVRRDPDQVVVLGFKKSDSGVKPLFPIYSFELQKPFD